MRAWMLANPNLSVLLLSGAMLIVCVGIIAAIYRRPH